jgi:hypothetical protein
MDCVATFLWTGWQKSVEYAAPLAVVGVVLGMHLFRKRNRKVAVHSCPSIAMNRT